MGAFDLVMLILPYFASVPNGANHFTSFRTTLIQFRAHRGFQGSYGSIYGLLLKRSGSELMFQLARGIWTIQVRLPTRRIRDDATINRRSRKSEGNGCNLENVAAPQPPANGNNWNDPLN
jgi:hypothetical protein